MSTATGHHQVAFLDLQALHREMHEELTAAAAAVIGSDRVLLGPRLTAFEASWAAQVGAREAVGVGSGLDALVLALRALGVGPGAEVVVPSHTFVATWLAVLHLGAVPVAVDVESATGTWDPAAVAAAVGPRTRALLPVHMYGHPVDLAPLLDIADRHGLVLVDDAAQAHGARTRGVPVGADGHATAWSFYPGKNLGALGDGGAVTTSDTDVAARVRSLRNYGSRVKYVHDEVGYNSRLDELQAALLEVKLRHLAVHQARRVAVAAAYADGLADCDLELPVVPVGTEPAWHLYVVRTPHRDALQQHLAARGVQTLVHYPVPCHRQPAFAGTPLARQHLPVADALAAQVLSLPMGPHLSATDRDTVIDAVRSFRP
ncbi:dTDP-4-amino-4,6-dideoxygalactose transaminase [Klenkia soli]|uniref:dTDP-4-amino-4,6-dideoxygalactose transaminase n=1 Tax=Klenkia soli TaxID=1052260 RepID=A0A1H0CJ04_9ACTN|nr:DegT/DnrJ/EryC1/StrS family aminotransferase [Klenkia soli]SDN57845.1 dTDP-4-amino-4,6-dideoxygalactose transaminase [Klenkia soli]